jgi:hypothetical protein
MQIESWPDGQRLSIVSTGDRLTTAGMAAVLTTLGSYYAGLSTAQQAKLAALVNNQLVALSAYNLTCAVLAADAAAVAASLTTNVRTAGNTTPNS